MHRDRPAIGIRLQDRRTLAPGGEIGETSEGFDLAWPGAIQPHDRLPGAIAA
jgi:hypothetical protein